MSSCRKVGASEGGIDITPPNSVTPIAMEAMVTARMPINTAPRTFRASRATIRAKPSEARMTFG